MTAMRIPLIRCITGLFLAALLLFEANAFAQHSVGELAKRAIFASFNRPPSWPVQIWEKNGIRHIEICEDLCALVSWKSTDKKSDDFAWVTLFLYEYYLNESEFAERFRSLNKALANQIINQYSGDCPADKGLRFQAQCIMDGLGSTYSMVIAGVRYDEGFRCVVPFSPLDLKKIRGGGCFKLPGQ